MVEVAWMDVNVVKLGERGLGGIQFVGSQGCTNINPLAIADIRAQQLTFIIERRLWKSLPSTNLKRRVSE
jgi:hypothetical protein